MSSVITSHPIFSAITALLIIVGLGLMRSKYRVYWLYLLIPATLAEMAYEDGTYLYFCVFVFGMLTAFAEITNKFTDEPLKALGSVEALAYHLLNGAVACGALFVLQAAGVKSDTTIEQIKLVSVAGFGSMLIMRSKLFNVKFDGAEVAFGPEQVVNLFFRFMERAIDRLRAQARIELVTDNMKNLDFSKIQEYTKSMLQSAQTWDEEHRQAVCKKIDEIAVVKRSEPQLKSFDLGFLLLNEMGEDFLTALYQSPKPEWLLSAPIPNQPNPIERIMGRSPAPAFYFSYGPNLSTQVFLSRLGRTDLDVQSFERLVKPMKAKLAGYKVAFNKPVDAADPEGVCEINLECDENSYVEGILYQLNKDSLEFLNRTEPGYSLNIVKVKPDKGDEVECQAFMYGGIRGNGHPTKEYLASLVRGARQRHLSTDYIDELKKAAEDSKNGPSRNQL